MRQITINCAAITTPRQLHKALSEALEFPQWYGKNLDALHDCLTELSDETQLTLLHFGTLGSFSGGFRRVLQDCEDENTHLRVFFK